MKLNECSRNTAPMASTVPAYEKGGQATSAVTVGMNGGRMGAAL